jgi:hypothetical protein
LSHGQRLVVNDGSLDTFPDFSALPDCCPLCCQPSDFQFADYLRFPDDPLDQERNLTLSSSSTDASWTPSQATLESDDVCDLNSEFLGSEFPPSYAQYEYNSLQPSSLVLFNTNDDFLLDSTNELPLSSAFEPFEMDVSSITNGNRIDQPSRRVRKPDFLCTSGPDNFPFVPNSTSSNALSLFHEPVQRGDIQPCTATTSLEMQTSEAFQVSNVRQFSNQPSPVGQFTCSWRGCQTSFDRVARLRHATRLRKILQC